MLKELDRINAVVIGATRGIGLGFVRSLLNDERVETLFCTYRTEESPEQLSLKKAHRERLHCLKMDVTDESQIAVAAQQIGDAADKIHLAIYCTGVLHEGDLSPEKSLRDLSSEHLTYSFQVNSIGAALVAKHLAPLFDRHTPSMYAAISAKVGSIGDNRLGGWYGYRASKAALNMFMKTIAIEFGHRCPNTIVVALHPGTTDTKLSEPFQENVPESQLSSVEETVDLLTDVMGKLKQEDSGAFYSWDGTELPW